MICVWDGKWLGLGIGGGGEGEEGGRRSMPPHSTETEEHVDSCRNWWAACRVSEPSAPVSSLKFLQKEYIRVKGLG